VICAVLLLTRYFFIKTPESVGQALDGQPPNTSAIQRSQPKDANTLPGLALWRNGAFITLSAGMAIGLFAQTGLLAHLFNLFSPAIGAQRMGWLMGWSTACASVGRSIAARAVQRYGNRRVVASAGYVVQAVGSAILLLSGGHNVWLITIGVILFGSG